MENINHIFIRTLTQNDQSFLWQMLYEVIYVPEGEPAPARDIIYLPQLACYVERWGGEGDNGYAAVDEISGELCGAVWLRIFTGEYKGFGYVSDGIPELSIAVLKRYRGQGVGTKLMQRILDSNCSLTPISLSVARASRAVDLYQRFGFKVVHFTDDSYTMLRE